MIIAVHTTHHTSVTSAPLRLTLPKQREVILQYYRGPRASQGKKTTLTFHSTYKSMKFSMRSLLTSGPAVVQPPPISVGYHHHTGEHIAQRPASSSAATAWRHLPSLHPLHLRTLSYHPSILWKERILQG